jgi:hemerythrin
MENRMNKPEHVPADSILDREHDVQVALLQAFHAALAGDTEPDTATEILARLADYSSAHFLSEELLMRLASYDGYDDHVADHVRMLDELARIQAEHASGQAPLAARHAREVEAFLLQHIQTRDGRFAAWSAGSREVVG